MLGNIFSSWTVWTWRRRHY